MHEEEKHSLEEWFDHYNITLVILISFIIDIVIVDILFDQKWRGVTECQLILPTLAEIEVELEKSLLHKKNYLENIYKILYLKLYMELIKLRQSLGNSIKKLVKNQHYKQKLRMKIFLWHIRNL